MGKVNKKAFGLNHSHGTKGPFQKIMEMVKGWEKLFAWTKKFLEHVKNDMKSMSSESMVKYTKKVVEKNQVKEEVVFHENIRK